MSDRNRSRGDGRSSEDGETTPTPSLRADDVLEGSNGNYYTGWEVLRRLRSDAWRYCLRQDDPDRWLVETRSGSLLSLVPVSPSALPPRVEIRLEGESARVVRARRGSRR